MKEKQNGKGKLEQHSHKKEITYYKCEQHRNPCVKKYRSRLCDYIKTFLKNIHSKRLQLFKPLLPFQEVYL